VARASSELTLPQLLSGGQYHGHYNEQYIDGLYGALVVADEADAAALSAGA
jgi:FtsP/CotA-like multicopper oxidase with cupredoxin domain